jgi:hypothetical protein
MMEHEHRPPGRAFGQLPQNMLAGDRVLQRRCNRGVTTAIIRLLHQVCGRRRESGGKAAV